MDESALVKQFVALSRYAGSRFDLVQAGGGNSSLKLSDDRMLVKASGFPLSELDQNSGYATVDYVRVKNILETPSQWSHRDKRVRDAHVARLVGLATSPSENRASIEVFLHAVLGRFVLHTHPIAVNMIAAQNGWADQFTRLFEDALCIDYLTPGIELGTELLRQFDRYVSTHAHPPKIIFLQNHGLIVSAETADEVQRLTENVVIKCEQSCGMDFGRYRAVTEIAEYVGNDSIVCLCEDRVISDLIKFDHFILTKKPLNPDGLVYCGVVPLILEDSLDPAKLHEYLAAYLDTPKVIFFRGGLYFVAHTIKKAKEAEEVFKAHLLILSVFKTKINFLSDSELAYLGNWEAEKFRSKK